MKHNYRFVFLTIFSLFFYFNITVPTSATTILNILHHFLREDTRNIDSC